MNDGTAKKFNTLKIKRKSIQGMVFVEFDRFWFANKIEPMRFEQYAKVFRGLVKQKLDSIDFGFLGDNLKVELDSMY